MTSGAWAAWLAIKILWESALRQKSGDGSAIAEYLTRDSTQFDGHKGQPLSFRAWDHQLRQPLYVVSADAADGRRIKEVPESSDGSLRDALDRLGSGRATSVCTFAR
jgi:ABC-type branched-subunit amino acid transport system substrate-binding protein